MGVAIIGAGCAGLQQARALQKRGIGFHIFETEASVGGVWRNAPLQAAQVAWEFYSFPEYPWPEEVKSAYPNDFCPPGPAVKQYCELYAARYDLKRYISFSCKVTDMQRPKGKQDGWLLTAQGSGNSLSTKEYDFVVLATGSFLEPHLPALQDEQSFKGKVFTAQGLSTEKVEVGRGRQVAVIGAGKSALDAAGLFGEVADSVTMLTRKEHRWLPKWTRGWMEWANMVYTRFGVWMTTHPYPSAHPSLPAITGFLNWALKPTKQLIWLALAVLLPFQYRRSDPQSDLFVEVGLHSPFSLFVKHLRNGKIHVVTGQPEAFTSTGLRTATKEEIAADVIVLATGWKRKYRYLPAKELAALQQTSEGIPLYRELLPVHVQGLAFLSGEVLTFNAMLTAGLQAEWLAALIQGDLKLPATEVMEEDVAQKLAWRYSFMQPDSFRDGTMGIIHQLLAPDVWEALCRALFAG